MKKYLICIVIAAFIMLTACTKQENSTKEYIIKTVESLDATNWNDVEKADISTYKWVESNTYNSYGQLVLVKDYGFVCKLSCEESNPFVNCTEDNGEVYKDSAMEFFIMLDDSGYILYQLVSSKNLI